MMSLRVVVFPGAGHFFHGQLLSLRDQVKHIVTEEGISREAN